MKLLVTISGSFSEGITDWDLSALREDLEDTLRTDWGGNGISVEVERA